MEDLLLKAPRLVRLPCTLSRISQAISGDSGEATAEMGLKDCGFAEWVSKTADRFAPAIPCIFANTVELSVFDELKRACLMVRSVLLVLCHLTPPSNLSDCGFFRLGCERLRCG